MRKNITIYLIVFSLTIVSSVSGFPIEESYIDLSAGHILFSTAGPISQKFTTINLENGSPSDIKMIQRFIDSKLIQFVIPLFVLPVNHLNFSVTYEKNIHLPRSSKAFYSSIGFYDNGELTNATTFINQQHTVILKEFAGYFLFSKSHPFQINKGFQAKFMFVGSCEHILLIN